MVHYQISKYADQESDTWSSVTHIGNVYQGVILSQEEYLRVENLYMNFIEWFLIQSTTTYKVTFLMDLRGGDGADKLLFNLDCSNIKIRGGEYLGAEAIITISRLCLRDLMGVRLEADSGFYITFGYDFYLRVGVTDDYEGLLDGSPINGLFVNQMENDPTD